MARPCACNRPLAGRIIQRDRRDCPAAGIQQAGSALYLLNTCVISKQLLIHQNLNPSGRQASLPWGHAKPPPETCQYSSMLQCRISAAAFNYFSCTRKLSVNHTLIIRVHFIETTPFTSPYYPSPQRLVNLFDPDSTFFFLPKKNIRSRWCHWRDAVNAESGR